MTARGRCITVAETPVEFIFELTPIECAIDRWRPVVHCLDELGFTEALSGATREDVKCRCVKRSTKPAGNRSHASSHGENKSGRNKSQECTDGAGKINGKSSWAFMGSCFVVRHLHDEWL